MQSVLKYPGFEKGPTMRFTRYPNWCGGVIKFPEDPRDYGHDKSPGLILNDSWVVNLKSMEDVNMGDGGCCGKQVLKAYFKQNNIIQDVDGELKDLLVVYTEAKKDCKTKEKSLLESMDYYMERYLKAKNERIEISKKLKMLESKMAIVKKEEKK